MRKLIIALVMVLLAASNASAATLDVVGGQLLGASGVIVDGSSYNVEFLDGTCIDLYSGCDAISDFTFQTRAAAMLAAQALGDQVFVDGVADFMTNPSLTNGCSGGGTTCGSYTPYALGGAGGGPTGVASELLLNFAGATPSAGSSDPGNASVSIDFTGSGVVARSRVWAVWAPVPEPGTAVLLGLGLLGLSVRNRRESESRE